VANVPNQSAGFLLADAGFDVWLGNIRGNFYSVGHVNYTRDDLRYWQFSWDEMSKYDLETMIDRVLEITKQKYVYYMAHSQGTEIMFAKLSSNPKFGKKIRKFFAIAPVSTVGHIKGLFDWLGKCFGNKFSILKLIFGNREFPSHSWLISLFASEICDVRVFLPVCSNVVFLIGGPNTDQLNKTRIPIYLSHIPAGTSTRNIIHWAQMRMSKKMQMYDFGSAKENIARYGQPDPPLYNLSRLNVPTYLFYSDSDWLADPIDVNNSLLNVISGKFLKFTKKLPNFNHLDFIWGERAAEEVYSEIIKYAQQYEKAIRGRSVNY